MLAAEKEFMSANVDICYLDEVIIEGKTLEGKKFRPSDWVDRLCGMLAEFEGQKVAYSPYLRPMMFNGMQCVAVKRELEQKLPVVFRFIMQFATDNQLIVTDCANFKLRAKAEV
jgi:hypothetical protein